MNKKILSLTISVSLFCLAGVVNAAIAQIGPSDFGSAISGIVTAAGSIVGSLGTVMFIVAGIFYVTSGGSPERMGLAKKTLIYAIIGMAVGFGADAIVAFVKTTTGGGQ